MRRCRSLRSQARRLCKGALGFGLTLACLVGFPGVAAACLSTSYTAPTADFAAAPNPAIVGQAVNFDASSSQGGTSTSYATLGGVCEPTDTDWPITNYHWDFGDGTNGTADTQDTSSPRISHTYSAAGSYTVTLITSTMQPSKKNSTPSSSTITVSKANTTTNFASGSNPSVAGDSVTFNATTTVDSPGATSLGGTWTWTFGDGGTATGPSVTHTFTAGGTPTVTVSYSGDTNTNPSQSSQQQTVNKAGAAVALTSSKNPSTQGDSLTFTAAVTSSYGTPTGTVQFFDGAMSLGSGTVNGGNATYSTNSLASGSHSISATYQGDDAHSSQASNTVTQTVNAGNSASGNGDGGNGSNGAAGTSSSTGTQGGSTSSSTGTTTNSTGTTGSQPCAALKGAALATCQAQQTHNKALAACAQLKKKARAACVKKADAAYRRTLRYIKQQNRQHAKKKGKR